MEIKFDEIAELKDHGDYSGRLLTRIFKCTKCKSEFILGAFRRPLFCPMCGREFSGVLRREK